MVATSLLPELQAALLALAGTRGGSLDQALETRLRRRVYAAVGGAAGASIAQRTLGGVAERGDFRDDDALLTALRAQDASALQTAVARYGGQLLGFTLRKLPGRDEDQAEEIVGDAFIVLWKKAGQFEDRSNLKALLFKVVRDKLVDHYRKRARMLDIADDVDPDASALEDEAPDPLASLLIRERRDSALRLLDEHCNPLEQDILLMTGNGMTDSEISVALDISKESVRQSRSRGRKKLRKALGHG